MQKRTLNCNFQLFQITQLSSDRFSAKFVMNRTEDSFAVWSHALASKAHDDGFYNDEIVPCDGSFVENGINKD